jgi:hypothetical protein
MVNVGCLQRDAVSVAAIGVGLGVDRRSLLDASERLLAALADDLSRFERTEMAWSASLRPVDGQD